MVYDLIIPCGDNGTSQRTKIDVAETADAFGCETPVGALSSVRKLRFDRGPQPIELQAAMDTVYCVNGCSCDTVAEVAVLRFSVS
mmetsp:Transcript_525/g.1514  ORF Transcript_525/g.1514 Transcript_525/m.1514 type:complete len:85 (-) Transcript_525:4803-5057(-)